MFRIGENKYSAITNNEFVRMEAGQLDRIKNNPSVCFDTNFHTRICAHKNNQVKSKFEK
jgi:hypothetical protein